MQSIVLSNIPHYHYLAHALESSGRLARYITSTAVLEGETAPRFLPSHYRQKYEGRRLVGVPPQRVKRIRLPEAIQRGLPTTHIVSGVRATWINNHLFDLIARRFIKDCDVLHFVSSVGLHSARRAKSLGAKIICDVRQEHPHYQARVLAEEAERTGIRLDVESKICEPKVLDEFELADYFIVPSTYAKSTFVAEGFDAEKIFVLPYGVDLTQFRQAEKSDDVFRILYVGRITLRKGVHYLLQAFKELNLPNAELLLIGQLDPPLEPVLKQYQGWFKHLPSVPKIELYRYYSNSSVFVLPSLADSFALVVLEAMACGLPVIISDHTGAQEALSENVNGFITPIRDTGALKNRIGYFYENEEARREMGVAAARQAHAMTWSEYERRANKIYDLL